MPKKPIHKCAAFHGPMRDADHLSAFGWLPDVLDGLERVLPPPPEPLFGYAEASRYLSIPVGSLYAMVSRAEIPFLRLGARTVRFRRSELEAWLASNANRPAAHGAP